MECDQVKHRASKERKGDNINISFLPVAPNTIRLQSEQIEVTSSDIPLPISSDKPAFGPRSSTGDTCEEENTILHETV